MQFTNENVKPAAKCYHNICRSTASQGVTVFGTGLSSAIFHEMSENVASLFHCYAKVPDCKPRHSGSGGQVAFFQYGALVAFVRNKTFCIISVR